MPIVLCGKPGRCCPTIVVKEDDGTIREELTQKEKEILKQKVLDGEL